VGHSNSSDDCSFAPSGRSTLDALDSYSIASINSEGTHFVVVESFSSKVRDVRVTLQTAFHFLAWASLPANNFGTYKTRVAASCSPGVRVARDVAENFVSDTFVVGVRAHTVPFAFDLLEPLHCISGRSVAGVRQVVSLANVNGAFI
jgi:hypothetical protein